MLLLDGGMCTLDMKGNDLSTHLVRALGKRQVEMKLCAITNIRARYAVEKNVVLAVERDERGYDAELEL